MRSFRRGYTHGELLAETDDGADHGLKRNYFGCAKPLWMAEEPLLTRDPPSSAWAGTYAIPYLGPQDDSDFL